MVPNVETDHVLRSMDWDQRARKIEAKWMESRASDVQERGQSLQHRGIICSRGVSWEAGPVKGCGDVPHLQCCEQAELVSTLPGQLLSDQVVGLVKGACFRSECG